MTVPESDRETQHFRSLPPAENALVVAFRHAAGDLMVRVWEQDCRQSPPTFSAPPKIAPCAGCPDFHAISQAVFLPPCLIFCTSLLISYSYCRYG